MKGRYFMKYIKQFLIIIIVSCLGEILNRYIPLPIPASIYGLVIMLGLLMSKILKLEVVKEVADFLINIMPIMFIPASVGLITYWEQLKPILLPYVIITLLSTILVMISTGKVTDWILKLKEDK